MAFFEQLGKRITDAGQGVAQQTKNFADITRLNSAVSDKERKIAQLYQSIGQSYYERHSGDAEPQLQPAVEEIKALGLDVPPMAELAQTLRDKGLPLPEGILTVSDMVKELKDVLCPSK